MVVFQYFFFNWNVNIFDELIQFSFFLKNLRFLVVLSVLATLANGYNILVLGPHMAKSHWMFMSSFVKALIDRGHEITYLTSNSLKNLNLANYTEVLIDPPLDLHAKSMHW